MQLNGAEIVIECLKEQGVDTVFGYPGGAILNVYDELYKHRDEIRHILTSHEQGASHAADGYARATGKVGVCLATSGPGATNLVTGIATAYMDSIPIVAITCNVGVSLLGKDSFQEIDIAGITMPITKYSFIVKDVTKLADTIRKAFRIAKTGRPGPVLVDIPKDITAKVTEYIPEELGKCTKEDSSRKTPRMDEQRFDRVISMLEEAEKPFVFVGGGAVLSGASQELKEFVDKLDAPVTDSLMGKGAFPGTDPRYTGMLGMHGTKTAAEALKHCDLFLAVGTRFSDRVICNANLFARHCPIIQIDIDPAEFNKNIDVTLKLGGDAKQILSLLNEKLEQQNHKEWIEQIKAWKKEYPLRQEAIDPNGVTPQMLFDALNELTKSEAIIATEVGQHQMWAAQFYEFRHPRQFITSGGLGTMGFGLGAAMGAQLANPDKKVINIAGDGSFHMNCNELSTLAKYQIPMMELVVDNSVLGMVRQWQKLFYDNRFSQTTQDKKTDFVKLAEAFGVKAFEIHTKDELIPVLKEALGLKEPVLVACHIHRDFNVLPMVPAGASAEEPILEM